MHPNLCKALILILVGFIFHAECPAQAVEPTMMPMRDGVRLATDIYRPAGADGPLPVILVRTPYGRNNSRGYGRNFADHGYVVAIQDVRGTGDSEGDFELWIHEGKDGYDAVEWLAGRPWCKAKVGMIGGSYAGWVQLAAAAERPPHLVTIVPRVTMGDPFFHHIRPFGMFHTGQNLQAVAMFEDIALGLGNSSLTRRWKTHEEHLPIVDLDTLVLGRSSSMWRQQARHDVHDAYWSGSSVLEKLEHLDLPVFLQGGWFDFSGIGTKLVYRAFSRSKNEHIKLIIGPWTHRLEGTRRVGGNDFGETAEVNLQELARRWFDHWLKGEKSGILDEPLVQLFAVGANRWLKGGVYPLPGTEFRRLYLATGVTSPDAKTANALRWREPQKESSFDTYVYDPSDPTPSLFFGATTSYDQVIERRKDILVYETKPFEQSLLVAGPISAKLYASSSAKDTDWVVYWRMIDETGSENRLIGRGTLRARHRNGPEPVQLLQPDSVTVFNLDLWHTAVQIPPGWRIRLEIASACFPDYSRNLNTGGHNEIGTEHRPATQRIFHSAEYPSHLLLPCFASEPRKNKAHVPPDLSESRPGNSE